MTTTLINKLTERYSGAAFTNLAIAGQWADAANSAAAHGLWGIWEELRNAAGLPSTDEAKAEWCKAEKARRAARFAKK